MPSRIVREGILTSERVNALSPQAEVFYRRLMSVVDDFGRIEMQIEVLRARCYPLQIDRVSPSNVREWLSNVREQELVAQYEVNGKEYLQINNFGQRERTSKHPAPSNDRVCPQVLTFAARASTPTPTPTPTPNARESERTEPPPAFDEVADRMWKRHPKKKGKILFEQALAKVLSESPAPEALAQKIERVHKAWALEPGWQKEGGKYAPRLDRWILEGGFEDDLPAADLDDEPIVATDEMLENYRRTGLMQ